MKLMSFAMAVEAFKRHEKVVTRRLGWRDLKPGDIVGAAERCQGLKRGETVTRLGSIRIVDVRVEPLDRMIREPEYGRVECVLEGFPDLTGAQFVWMFCKGNKCQPGQDVTRIEYAYVDDADIETS